MSIGLRKTALQMEKSTALEGIRRIKETGEYDLRAKLHRITLSTDKDKRKRKVHTFKAVEGFLCGLWLDENYRPEDRGNHYGKKFIRQRDDSQINVFTAPLSGYYPLMMIEVHPREDIPLETHKTFLFELCEALPGLKASSVEYPIDVNCSRDADPLDVDNYYARDTDSLFWIFRHSLLIPYQRTTKFYADEDCKEKFAKTGKRANFSIQWGSHKVYERGQDKNRKEDGWDYDDVDRMRLEHTADWNEIRKHGIITLEDLIREPKFHEINKDIWNFKRFKQTKRSKKNFLRSGRTTLRWMIIKMMKAGVTLVPFKPYTMPLVNPVPMLSLFPN